MTREDRVFMMYMSLVAFLAHPGYLREGAVRPTFYDLLEMAVIAVDCFDMNNR